MRWLLTLMAAVGLAGCALLIVPAQPAPHNYVLLTPGQSTIYDAVRLLGPPDVSTPLANGKTMLQWADEGWPRIHLAIPFDDRGRLIEIRHVYVD